MHPFSYTGLKVIHDQKIQEALTRQHLDTKQTMQRQGLHQTLKQCIARFNSHLAGNRQEEVPACSETSARSR